MNIFKNTKLLKKRNLAINIIVFILSYFVLFSFFKNMNYQNISTFFKDTFLSKDSLIFILLMLILSLVNWLLETMKWRLLMKSIVDILYKDAFKSVLLGIFFSLFIPNRAGDFIGRVYSINHQEKGKMAVATLIGSVAQLVVTLIFGAIGVTYFLYYYSFELISNIKFIIPAIAILWIIVFISVLLYFKSAIFYSFFKTSEKKFVVRLRTWLEILTEYNFSFLCKVLFISISRYIIFSFQLWFCLRFVGVDVKSAELYFFVAIYYFVLTFIPTVVYSEIGVRGSLSIYLFELLLFVTGSAMYDFELSVSIASVLVWIVNIVIPAIIGSFYFKRFNFFKS